MSTNEARPTTSPDIDDLDAAFASFGTLVDPLDVPKLVRSGVEVWSYGYGDDPESFTTIEVDDLWAWTEEAGDPAAVADWAPFRANV